MAEILDLVAKVSWDTNSEELKALNQQVKVQDKALEELRLKGRRLEEQLVKTNDPKKVKLYNEQLQAVKRSADAITEAQKKQATATESLKQKQKQLHDELRKNNDPKIVQGLLRGLHTVENQMDALTSKATTFGSKFSGVTNLLGGLGIGLGAGALVGGAISFLQGSIDEIIEAEKSARNLKLALEATGNKQYFKGLIEEATTLASKYNDLFDNDEIIQAQTELIKYGKFTREQLSSLTDITIELASKTGTDLVTASNKLVDILAGRGASTLRDFGISLKDAKTDTERLKVVFEQLAPALQGATDAFGQSAEGLRKKNEVLIANLKEQIGEKLLPIYIDALQGINEVLNGEWEKVGRNVVLGIEKVSDYVTLSGVGKKLFKAIFSNNEVKEGVSDDLRNFFANAFREAKADNAKGLATFNNAFKLTGGGNLNKNATEINEDEKKVIEKKVQTTKKTAEQKKKVEEEYYNDVTNLDKEYQKMLDDASKQSIERVQNANEKKYENNKKYKQMELDLIKENLDAELPDDVAEQKEKSRLAREELYNQVLNTANTAQEVINIEQQKTDRLIALQEERVNKARENSAVSLKIEQERLDALLEKRRKYERAQRIIDAGVIVANQAVAISGAIRQIATSKNFVEIAANVLAIGAGITASVLAVRNAFADDGFKEGGYTGDGDPNQESTAIGKRPYKYHKKEFVMDEELTSKHRDLFEGIHKRDLVIQKMDDGKYYIAPDTDRLVSDYYSSKSDSTLQPLLSEVAQMRKILAQREVNITNTFDADGFGQSVATQLGIAELKRMRR
jgi:flagellar biosynthesis GTPase FlhF